MSSSKKKKLLLLQMEASALNEPADLQDSGGQPKVSEETIEFELPRTWIERLEKRIRKWIDRGDMPEDF